MAINLGPISVGKAVWKIQAVGTGVLADTLPLDLGVLAVDMTTTGIDLDFIARLDLALAAFRAVMNEGR